MAALARQLFELVLLRRGPQDLPYSPPTVLSVALALVGLQLAFAMSQGLPAAGLVARAFVTLLMLLAVPALLLRWRGFDNRRAQVQLALAGTGLLFALVMLPAALALLPHLGSKEPPASVGLLSLLAIALFVWKLRVEAAIWRQSLEVPVPTAYAIALLVLAGEAILIFLLVPPIPGAPAS